MSRVIPEGLHGNTWFDLQCQKQTFIRLHGVNPMFNSALHNSECTIQQTEMN